MSLHDVEVDELSQLRHLPWQAAKMVISKRKRRQLRQGAQDSGEAEEAYVVVSITCSSDMKILQVPAYAAWSDNRLGKWQ